MSNNREQIEIDLKHLVQILWRKAWLIVLVSVACAALMFGYAYFFVTPQYAASVQLYVNNTYGTNTPGFSSSQIMAAQSLADTYMVILRSRSVLDEVAAVSGLPYSYNQLKGMVSAESVDDTEIFEVTVICEDYLHAAQIANAVAQVLPEKIAATVDTSSVRVVDYAVPSNTRISPSYSRNAILGLLVGAAITAALLVMVELTNDSITSEDYLTHTYGDIPLLAVVPDVHMSKSSGYYKGYYATQKPTVRGGGK